MDVWKRINKGIDFNEKMKQDKSCIYLQHFKMTSYDVVVELIDKSKTTGSKKRCIECVGQSTDLAVVSHAESRNLAAVSHAESLDLTAVGHAESRDLTAVGHAESRDLATVSHAKSRDLAAKSRDLVTTKRQKTKRVLNSSKKGKDPDWIPRQKVTMDNNTPQRRSNIFQPSTSMDFKYPKYRLLSTSMDFEDQSSVTSTDRSDTPSSQLIDKSKTMGSKKRSSECVGQSTDLATVSHAESQDLAVESRDLVTTKLQKTKRVLNSSIKGKDPDWILRQKVTMDNSTPQRRSNIFQPSTSMDFKYPKFRLLSTRMDFEDQSSITSTDRSDTPSPSHEPTDDLLLSQAVAGAFSPQYIRAERAKYPKIKKIVRPVMVFNKLKYLIQWKKNSSEGGIDGEVLDADIVHKLWPDWVSKFYTDLHQKQIISSRMN